MRCTRPARRTHKETTPWIGEALDNGTCKGFVAWHFERGEVRGVDVAGRTVVCLASIPGPVLEGNWKAAVYIDDGATDKQQQALLDVYTGKLGGPVPISSSWSATSRSPSSNRIAGPMAATPR